MHYPYLKRSALFFFATILFLSGCYTTPVTGSRSLIVVGEGEMAQLGDQAFRQTLAKTTRSSNGRWSSVVDRVSSRIVAATGKDNPSPHWDFVLLESKEVNAFALPGGHVAVYTGLMANMADEAELSAVIGHEVGHVVARHAAQRMTMALGTELGLEGLSLILGGPETPKKKLILQALGLGSVIGATLPFSRKNESEADEIGLVYMARAGYDPHAAPEFWRRQAARAKGAPPEFLSTHPSDENRMHRLETLLPKALAEYASSPKYGEGERLTAE